jgi:hypothetical protein
VNRLCELAGVSRAGYYRFRRRRPTSADSMDLRQAVPSATVLYPPSRQKSARRVGHPQASSSFGDELCEGRCEVSTREVVALEENWFGHHLC